MKIAQRIMIILAALGIVFVEVVMNGLVMSILWGWFIVPVFSLPELSIVQVIGIAIVVKVFAGTHYKSVGKDSDDEDSPWVVLGSAIFIPLAVLSLGWIVHLLL